MANLNNITGALLIDATSAFLNGAGLGSGEDKNKVIPKTFKEKVNGRAEEVPYVSAQSWRRWLRDTTNEENSWSPSELRGIKESEKGSTTKIATELNPIEFPEDDLFGYMKSGSKEEESIQRTSPFKTSILKGIRNMRVVNNDEAFVHLKEGTPLPYSTRFYSTHLEGFFNLEYYRLGVYDNLGSHQELSKELVEKHKDKFDVTDLYGGKFKRYTLKDAEKIRKTHAYGLLKGLAFLRGGAKQAAFGSDVSPKVLILAGMESANPVFNNLFVGMGEKPALNLDTLKQIATDYKDKLATPIYIGIRAGYLQNEEEIKNLDNTIFVVDSPIGVVHKFNEKYLK
ncbi:MAG: type I-B CRISPR-associated protein Cas7/Cst2/DevR [Thermoflexibacter sp.]|jgi:CRISPR-associated protein Cst2|nr:type I-B CRISPR-associated protein Cas7/Cst2/DevR [Thermoflexibacter sp.]